MRENNYVDFQKGMALCTQKVLEGFAPGHVFYINFLTDITAICDCWGLSTPALVPDVGVLAGEDIVAIEKATLDMIKLENLLPAGVPSGVDMQAGSGHLFERLHGKDPRLQYIQMEKTGLGKSEYKLVEVV